MKVKENANGRTNATPTLRPQVQQLVVDAPQVTGEVEVARLERDGRVTPDTVSLDFTVERSFDT